MNKHEEGFIWYLYGAMTQHLIHKAFPCATYEEQQEYIREREEHVYKEWKKDHQLSRMGA